MKYSFSAARTSSAAIFGLLALGVFTTAQACPCGCVKVTIDNLSERPAAQAGAYTLDLRYDYINQDERNNGAHAHFTALHRNLIATLETQLFGQTVAITVPRIDRTLETSSSSGKVVGLGDITVSTRFPWQGYTVIAGLKLPTGKDDLVLTVPRRYLQPGTGSTDLLLGLRKDFGLSTDAFTQFLQVQAQGSLLSDTYFRPGSIVSVSGGLRYELTPELSASLQATYLRQFRDKNTQSTVDATYSEDLESGGFETILAGGFSYKLSQATSAYVFYSEPVKVESKVPKTGGLVNPVHATGIWSVGVIHSF